MKLHKFRKRWIRLIVIIPLLSFTAYMAWIGFFHTKSSTDTGLRSVQADASFLASDFPEHQRDYYTFVFHDWQLQGYANATQTIKIPGGEISNHSDAADIHIGSYNGATEALIWQHHAQSWIEYEIEASQAGLYELEINYAYPDEEELGYARTVLSVHVDGQLPFREAKALELPKHYRHETPLRTNSEGDQLRPVSKLIDDWQQSILRDTEGRYTKPFQWYLSQGIHTIRLYSSDTIIIRDIQFKPPQEIHSYKQALDQYPEISISEENGLTIEAEKIKWKNAVEVQVQSERDALMTPVLKEKNVFNALGGEAWNKGRQSVTWDFYIETSGIYQIAFRTYQGFISNQSSYRTIYIDGVVPFKELLAYPIPYAKHWGKTLLKSDSGKPFEFYFEAGEHTLTLEATIAPLHEALIVQETINQQMNETAFKLNALVGGFEDRNRTWDIVNEFPELIDELTAIQAKQKQLLDILLRVNDHQTNRTIQDIRAAVDTMEGLLAYPNEIPHKLSQFGNIRERVAGLQQHMLDTPLMIDNIHITDPEVRLPRMKANVFERTKVTIERFIRSFSKNSRITNVSDEVLDVWMQYGRDNVNVLQEMADEYFTPQTGIKVNINQLPREDLLVMANAAGNVPDVALGISPVQPVQLAMRNAVVDLRQLEGFEELTSSFAPGSLQNYYYDDGYYALPDTQDFRMLFYRQDIMERLGLALPDTWQDVIEMLPTLQQNGYNFFLAPELETFIFQAGADFWTEDGTSSSLDTPEGFSGFRLLTDLYRKYGIEQQVPSFYQHFRDGTMPIGVSDFQTYLQLSIAAPELTGLWGIAPLPGIEQADGQIERWTGGYQASSVIMKRSKQQEDAWEFLKWWLGTDTQLEFGLRLENYYGKAFRWNSANAEAFSKLPWRDDELKALMEQWQWYKVMVHLPGSYLVEREMNNAWNQSVVGDVNDREALQEAIDRINAEVARKSLEFGLVDSYGKVLRTQKIPRISTPWKEVLQYADQ